jgi:hypothetical protein
MLALVSLHSHTLFRDVLLFLLCLLTQQAWALRAYFSHIILAQVHSVASTAKGATTFNSDGALEIIENHWLTLEDGVQVLFHRDIDAKPDSDADDLVPYYHTGDYWLIPARTATGDIEWPQRHKEHEALPPHGVKHHFAPIAYVQLTNNQLTNPSQVTDLRRTIKQGWEQKV